MPNFKEAVSHPRNRVKEYRQRYHDGLLDRMDTYDYLNPATDTYLSQAEHLQNRAIAIAQDHENLLNSLRAQRKQG